MAKKTFSSEYQPAPERRGGGPRSATFKLRQALEKKFASGEVAGFDTFDDWLVHKALEEGGVYLQIVASRAVPNYKPTLEPINVEYPENGTPLEKSQAVYKAMASGEVPPDVGAVLIDAISKMIAIEEQTELAKRIEQLEAALNNK